LRRNIPLHRPDDGFGRSANAKPASARIADVVLLFVGKVKKRPRFSRESVINKRSTLQQRSYTMAKKTKKKAKAKKKK
jgi:hypothetical protein